MWRSLGLIHNVLLLGCVMLVSCTAAISLGQPPPAELALLHGKIITVDSARPQAQAVAIRGDRIIAVGSDAEIQPFIGARTKVIDLKGKLAIPGFIEGHAHLLGLGQAKRELDLSRAKSWDEIITTVKHAAEKAKPGDWILGRGWHQEKWTTVPVPNVEGLPLHNSLSAVSPDNPVLLTHASGHLCIANAKAMGLIGITRETPDPEGGEILRDAQGSPVGIFQETAKDSIDAAQQRDLARRSPEQVAAAAREAIELAMQECAASGITSFCDAGELFKTIELLKQLAEEGKLPIRLWVMIDEGNPRLREHIAEYPLIGLGSNHLTVRAIKRYMDGALGSHTAWLLEPYTDLPQITGVNVTPLDTIAETARLAIEHGLQLCMHAIGDRANRETLNIYEKTFHAHPDMVNLRWRIEHAQHLHPDDVPRFAKLGVIAAMQGIHCTSDGPWVPKRLGEERAVERSYVWQKLLKSGAIVINGTDAPVEKVNPLACFYASVTRKLPDSTIFAPDQRMTREQALRSYTLDAAYAAFEDDLKGSIIPGKLADIAVLSKDIMTIPEDEIPTTQVVYTIVGGKTVYKR